MRLAWRTFGVSPLEAHEQRAAPLAETRDGEAPFGGRARGAGRLEERPEGPEEMRLVRVAQPHHGHGELRLDDAADGGGTRGEAPEEVGADVPRLGRLVHAHGRLGDHPERALAPGHELVEVGPGRRMGHRESAPGARR